MTLLGIAWRNIRQRLATSTLTALSLALGVALVVATLVTGAIVKRAFESGAGLGYNMIVGAKGSPLQLVLNSVYLISKPIENISWSTYQEFLPGTRRADGVDDRRADLHGRLLSRLPGRGHERRLLRPAGTGRRGLPVRGWP
jgi:putative ABC transport system permease protein